MFKAKNNPLEQFALFVLPMTSTSFEHVTRYLDLELPATSTTGRFKRVICSKFIAFKNALLS